MSLYAQHATYMYIHIQIYKPIYNMYNILSEDVHYIMQKYSYILDWSELIF